MIQQVPERVGDHPLGGLDPAEHQYRGVRDHLVHAEPGPCRRGDQRVGRIDARGNVFVQLGERRRSFGGHRPTGRDSRRPSRRSRCTSPAPSRPRPAAARASGRPPRRTTARPPSSAGRPARRRGWRPSTLDGLLHRLGEPAPGLGQAERRLERVPVRGVRGTVQGQHRRPDHLRRREARIVDGEGLRIPQHRQRQAHAKPPPSRRARRPTRSAGVRPAPDADLSRVPSRVTTQPP